MPQSSHTRVLLLNSSWPNLLGLYWTLFFKQIAFQNCSLNYSKVLFPTLSRVVFLRTMEWLYFPCTIFLSLFYRSCHNWLLLLSFSYQVVSDSFVTSWTVAHRGPTSMGFSRQEYWSGLLFYSSGGLLDWGSSPHVLHWQANSLPLSHLGSSFNWLCFPYNFGCYNV